MRFYLCIAAAAAALSMSGCAVTSVSTSPAAYVRYFSSRDGAFQYRLPSGWFDATADSSAAGNVAWLLREDYRATIAVQEIRLDEAAREEMAKGGLLRIAQLTAMLATGDRPTQIRRPPEALSVYNGEMVAYELMTAAREAVRVVLINARGRVYSVTAFAASSAERDNTFAVEEEFALGLRW